METPYWCTVLVHKYGRRKSTKTSGVRELVYVRINTSSNTLIRGETLFQGDNIPISVSRNVKTRKFKLSYFRNETCYGTEKMYKDLFFVYLQPSVNKTLWSVHFGVVVVELINCKCGGIVRNQIW